MCSTEAHEWPKLYHDAAQHKPYKVGVALQSCGKVSPVVEGTLKSHTHDELM